ncbi:MAG: hypothetical protein IJ742_03350 [Prevotella sp.]|nr:hypothetical protein [Prevotella sp.]
MRKFYLLFAALFAGSVVASAGVKNLYKQDFESAPTAADAGWTSPNLAGNMSIFSDEEGSAFQFSLGNNNNRNAVLNFNYGLEGDATIYDGQDVKKYSISFIWGLVKNPESTGNAANVQFSSEVAVLTPSVATSDVEGWKITTGINNGQYAANDSLRLFAISQLKGAYSDTNQYWSDNADNSNYAFDFKINNDENEVVTLEQGGWYQITINVDTEARTADYEIFSLNQNDVLKTGTYTIPEYASVYAKGLNVLLGRYNSIAQIDDVKVQQAMDGDYANAPTVALTGVENAKRIYTIFFEDGEILNVKKTDGTTDTAVESPYTYETETSGTLEVWTESGSAKSEPVVTEVKAEIIALPAAVIDITKVNAGYVKSLKMTADNSEIPTQPTITLTWEYTNGDASTGEVANGAIYEAKEKGTLTVTTHAYGFGETTVTFENDTEFAVDATVDFQHMDEAALTEKGFAEIDELRADNMSGESNWTARSYLWFGIENGETADDGTPAYDKHVVYGPTTNSEAEGIRRFYLKPSTLTADVAKTIFAPVYTWYTGEADPAVADGSDVAGLKVNYGIGLINTGCKTDDGTSINYANGIVGVDGLTDNDYYIAYVISNYGSTSKHPVYPQGTSLADGKALYKAENLGDGDNVNVLRGTETYTLYRIDTAIARIEVYKSTGSGIQEIGMGKVVSSKNAPIYTLNGARVSGNLKKGIYVKQGKKFIVK